MKGTGLTALPRHAQESSLYWFPIIACCVRACTLEDHELQALTLYSVKNLFWLPPLKRVPPKKVLDRVKQATCTFVYSSIRN